MNDERCELFASLKCLAIYIETLGAKISRLKCTAVCEGTRAKMSERRSYVYALEGRTPLESALADILKS
jgi:hypothetical protein